MLAGGGRPLGLPPASDDVAGSDETAVAEASTAAAEVPFGPDGRLILTVLTWSRAGPGDGGRSGGDEGETLPTEGLAGLAGIAGERNDASEASVAVDWPLTVCDTAGAESVGAASEGPARGAFNGRDGVDCDVSTSFVQILGGSPLGV